MPITQINDGNALNAAGGSSIRNRSRFVNKYPVGGTYRFGEYGVNFAAETVPDDDHTIHLGHNIISNTLKAPLLQDVIMKKDLFWVPDMCILPLNWEKFFVNPVKGDDVPNDVGCSVEHFGTLTSSFFNMLLSGIHTELGKAHHEDQDYIGDDNLLTLIFRFIISMEMIYSNGCLLAATEANLSGKLGPHFNFGSWFDRVLEAILTATGKIYYEIYGDSDLTTIDTDSSASEIRDMLSRMRDDFNFIVQNGGTALTAAASDLDDLFDELTISDADFPINLRRLWAYQIVCAHFYTNDKIDYVYSAELFRQLVHNSYIDLCNGSGNEYVPYVFTVNGLTYQYDYLSAKYFNEMLNISSWGFKYDDFYESLETGYAGYIFQYLRLLFGYNNSLRYLDYFTGSRSQPLAVGDYNVAVNNNLVNVVNIAATTMAAKMANVINRVGQRIKSYVKELFHIEMADDYHEPFWLAHTSDQIDNPENQNTGAAQYSEENSITSIFRTGGNSAGFETKIDRAGVIIGITYFDIQRMYPVHVNRNFFHIDRYDDFLPYLQYVGDQTVSKMELNSSLSYAQTFGYQGRNMEYKQQVPFCFGGFRFDLAPYVFLAYDHETLQSPSTVIGPSFIRCKQTELDRFFMHLNGFSIDTYYHFAIVNNIYWDAIRPMAALPGILNG